MIFLPSQTLGRRCHCGTCLPECSHHVLVAETLCRKVPFCHHTHTAMSVQDALIASSPGAPIARRAALLQVLRQNGFSCASELRGLVMGRLTGFDNRCPVQVKMLQSLLRHVHFGAAGAGAVSAACSRRPRLCRITVGVENVIGEGIGAIMREPRPGQRIGAGVRLDLGSRCYRWHGDKQWHRSSGTNSGPGALVAEPKTRVHSSKSARGSSRSSEIGRSRGPR